MALVSSLSPSAQSTFDLSSTPYSKSSPEPPQIRPLPTVSSSSHSAGRRTASTSSAGGGRSYSTGGGVRPLPTQYPSRSPSAPPFLEARSSCTPTTARPTLATSSSSLSNPPTSSRIARTPSPGVPSHSHSYSQSSSSGAPRLPPIQFSSGSNPPSSSAYSSQGQLHHPHFQPQQFPSLVYPNNTHAFPHPQYPFIPSPHPHTYQGPGPFSPGFPAGNDVHQQHQQHQAMLLQQAHLQQQQWQMEMMRNQAAAAAGQPVGQFEWNGQSHQGKFSSLEPPLSSSSAMGCVSATGFPLALVRSKADRLLSSSPLLQDPTRALAAELPLAPPPPPSPLSSTRPPSPIPPLPTRPSRTSTSEASSPTRPSLLGLCSRNPGTGIPPHPAASKDETRAPRRASTRIDVGTRL